MLAQGRGQFRTETERSARSIRLGLGELAGPDVARVSDRQGAILEIHVVPPEGE